MQKNEHFEQILSLGIGLDLLNINPICLYKMRGFYGVEQEGEAQSNCTAGQVSTG